jgi:hypothetical protein
MARSRPTGTQMLNEKFWFWWKKSVLYENGIESDVIRYVPYRSRLLRVLVRYSVRYVYAV